MFKVGKFVFFRFVGVEFLLFFIRFFFWFCVVFIIGVIYFIELLFDVLFFKMVVFVCLFIVIDDDFLECCNVKDDFIVGYRFFFF